MAAKHSAFAGSQKEKVLKDAIAAGRLESRARASSAPAEIPEITFDVLDSPPSDSLPLGEIAIGLAGGLALFLFGMRQMTEALKIIAGERMKRLLARFTSNRFSGVLAGTAITAVIQSSSVTTVLVVGFVSAGLMGLSQSIGVIIGANVGTTITAQIIAFKITNYAMLFIGVGFFVELGAKKERVRQWGLMIMGLGLLFFGMGLMSQATAPLRTHPGFITWMQNMQNPALAVATAAIFTALVQSSSATTGLVIVLAGGGFISLPAGIALIMGANVGTCVTAMLSAIGKPREATRVAIAHVAFNLLGVCIFVWLIPQLAESSRGISPSFPELDDTARLAAESPRQIANAHTLFNVANAFLFIWLTGPLARLATWLAPDLPEAPGSAIEPEYLDDYFLENPAMALECARREEARMATIVGEMLDSVMPAIYSASPSELARVGDMDEGVDALHVSIIRYLGLLSQEQLVTPHTEALSDGIAITNYLENIGDVIETDLVGNGVTLMQKDLSISAATREILQPLSAKVCWAFAEIAEAIASVDSERIHAVIHAKQEVKLLATKAGVHLSKRLAVEPNRQIEAFRIESEIVENLKRIYYLTRRIAKTMEDNLVVESESKS